MKFPKLHHDRHGSPWILGLWLMVLLSTLAWGDVKSKTGKLKFDANRDGSPEMTLNGDALKVGGGTASANLDVTGNAIFSEQLGVGTENPSSNLHIGGTLALGIQTISGNGSVGGNALVLVDNSSGNISLSLPDPRSIEGWLLHFKGLSATYDIRIGGGSGPIDNETPLHIPSGNKASVKLVSAGNQWYIIEAHGFTSGTAYSSNLLLHWTLDDASGSVASDSSGSGYSANLTTGVDFSTRTIAASAVSQGVTFSDAFDEVFTDATSISFPREYAWSLWVYLASSDPTLLYNNPTPPEGVFGFVVSDGTCRGNVHHRLSDDSVVTTGTNSMTAGAWNHIGATWDGTILKAYLNGSLESQTTAASIYGTQGGNVQLRHRGDCDTSMGLDDFQLFDRALNDVEVLGLFHAGTASP